MDCILAIGTVYWILHLYIHADGRDYGNSTGSLVFIFNATHNSSLACVPLVKDDMFEITEVLEATLRLLGRPSSSLVSLASTASVITIFDDDGKQYKFL